MDQDAVIPRVSSTQLILMTVLCVRILTFEDRAPTILDQSFLVLRISIYGLNLITPVRKGDFSFLNRVLRQALVALHRYYIKITRYCRNICILCLKRPPESCKLSSIDAILKILGSLKWTLLIFLTLS